MSKTNLFCLPFAGGSKYSYNEYTKVAGHHVNLIPLEVPGRGGRVREQLLTDLNAMVDDIWFQIKDRLQERYAIYGHSMGTMIGYLLVKKILRGSQPPPVELFFSGCGAPSIVRDRTPRHDLPRQQFIEKLMEYGGSPDEVLTNESLLSFYEPILRADFKALENYKYQPSAPFNIPITVMIGLEEKTTYEEAEEWKKETLSDVNIHQFPGRHFFIFNYPREIMQIVSEKLQYQTV